MITQTSTGCTFRRTVAGTVTVCLLGVALPPARPGRAYSQANVRVQAAAEPEASPPAERFLRDSIPATAFATDPPDSSDDDFVLPEEKDKKQLVKEIAVWALAAAFVAFFIVKVFIEDDDEAADDDDGGKVIPPPQ